jgi:hypothetical protein
MSACTLPAAHRAACAFADAVEARFRASRYGLRSCDTDGQADLWDDLRTLHARAGELAAGPVAHCLEGCPPQRLEELIRTL